MKILLTNHDLSYYAGTETFVYTLAVELQRTGHEVVCFSPRLGAVAQRLVTAGVTVTAEHIEAVATWDAKGDDETEIAFMPARVVLQDFTGVPSIVDLAAANWNTSLGAACFLACALDTLRTDKASKMPLRRELRALEHEFQREISS